MNRQQVNKRTVTRATPFPGFPPGRPLRLPFRGGFLSQFRSFTAWIFEIRGLAKSNPLWER